MMNQVKPTRHKPAWLKVLVGLGIGIGLLLVAAYLLLFHVLYSFADLPLLFRPLPSDEDMIANFHEHRAQFEYLVWVFQQDPSILVKFHSLIPTPEIRATMDQINVSLVHADGFIWVAPDPYSRDPDVLERMLPSYVPRGDYLHLSAQSRKLSGVKLSYTYGTVITFQYDLISKNYYYIPLIPQVFSHGDLRFPAHPATGYSRIVESLNKYPPNFGQYDCLYKQIEPHWFIEMCRRK
jgi:hypothetical protein